MSVLVRSPPVSRRQPLLRSKPRSRSYRLGEVVGATTAECAAVCCCCPCALANLLVLAIYKVPAGLCRRALKNKRHKKLVKKGLLPPRLHRCTCGCDDSEVQIHPLSSFQSLIMEIKPEEMMRSEESEKEALALEKEMWDRFYNTGFWRSPSQREIPTVKNCNN